MATAVKFAARCFNSNLTVRRSEFGYWIITLHRNVGSQRSYLPVMTIVGKPFEFPRVELDPNPDEAVAVLWLGNTATYIPKALVSRLEDFLTQYTIHPGQ
jgi:hypothetical protein